MSDSSEKPGPHNPFAPDDTAKTHELTDSQVAELLGKTRLGDVSGEIAKAILDDQTSQNQTDELNNYRQAFQEEFSRSEEAVEQVNKTIDEIFIEHGPHVAAKMVGLALGAKSELVAANASRYIIDHLKTLTTGNPDSDPFAKLLADLGTRNAERIYKSLHWPGKK